MKLLDKKKNELVNVEAVSDIPEDILKEMSKKGIWSLHRREDINPQYILDYINYNHEPCTLCRVHGTLHIVGYVASQNSTMYAGGGPGKVKIHLYDVQQFERVYGHDCTEKLKKYDQSFFNHN